jgi:hypothetical protein
MEARVAAEAQQEMAKAEEARLAAEARLTAMQKDMEGQLEDRLEAEREKIEKAASKRQEEELARQGMVWESQVRDKDLAVKAAQEELQKAQKNLEEQVKERVSKETKAVAEQHARQLADAQKARQSAEYNLKKAEESLEEQVEKRLAEETKALAQQHTQQLSEAQKARKAAEYNLKKAEENLEEQLKEQVEIETKKVEDQMFAALHERENRLRRAEKTIETLKKQVEAKPAGELGGMQEDQLVTLLRAEFPKDRINLVPKGHAGADVMHEVVHEGDACGLIIYESKNVQAWQKQFVDKLTAEQVKHGANYAVLVSTAFPAQERDFCIVGNVLVVSPRLAISVAAVLRGALVELKLLDLSRHQHGFKLEQLMIFLNSPEFKNRMQALVRAVDKLEGLQQKERKAHDKTWTEQRLTFSALSNTATEIGTEIQVILTGK